MEAVTVTSTEHGSFIVKAIDFERMFESIVNNVNMSYGGYRSLCALITEANSVDYFGAGMALIAAVLVDQQHTTESVANFLSADNTDWADDVYAQYVTSKIQGE